MFIFIVDTHNKIRRYEIQFHIGRGKGSVMGIGVGIRQTEGILILSGMVGEDFSGEVAFSEGLKKTMEGVMWTAGRHMALGLL